MRRRQTSWQHQAAAKRTTIDNDQRVREAGAMWRPAEIFRFIPDVAIFMSLFL